MNTPDDILKLLKKYNQTDYDGFATAFSSVSVVANSLMLRRYVPTMERGIAKEVESAGSKI